MKKLALLVTLLVLASALLSSCGGSPGPVASTSTTASPAPVLTTAEATATPEPSATPAPGRVILLAPASTEAAAFQAALSELAASSGLRVDMQPDLAPGQAGPEVRSVVALNPPVNLTELVAASPQVQFVVVSTTDLPPAGNLTVIRHRSEMQAFLSGFIVALLSPDYRAAGLLPSDGPLGSQLSDAFTNGGRYYCGTCAPGWPLNFVYPHPVANPAASDEATWQAGLADAFDNKKVDVVYLAPEAAAHPEIQSYLQGRTQFDRTMVVVGAEPPPAPLQAQWAASVGFDDLEALRQVWPGIAAGQGGASVDAPLALENVNPALLEAGKMRLVKNLMAEIQAGDIFPFTVAP